MSTKIITHTGFRISTGSDISPQELSNCGFQMSNFKFYPYDINFVKKQIEAKCDSGEIIPYRVIDLSKNGELIYCFKKI